MSNVLIRRIKKRKLSTLWYLCNLNNKTRARTNFRAVMNLAWKSWNFHRQCHTKQDYIGQVFHLCNHIVINQSQLESNWPVKLWCTDTSKWTTYRILSYQILHFLCKMTKIHVPTISMTCFFHIHAVSRSLGIVAVKCKTTENLIK